MWYKEQWDTSAFYKGAQLGHGSVDHLTLIPIESAKEDGEVIQENDSTVETWCQVLDTIINNIRIITPETIKKIQVPISHCGVKSRRKFFMSMFS